MPPLVIYPEGCTTNNEYLIQFRKGAFFGLHSVQPICMKYSAPFMNPAHDVMPMFAHFIFMMQAPFITLNIKQYPVFKPNDYFWKHHWDEKGGEEKW